MLKKLKKVRKNKKVARKPLRSVTKVKSEPTLQCIDDHCNEEDLHGIPYDLRNDILLITQLLDDCGCYRYFTSFGGGSMLEYDVKLMEKRMALFLNWSFLQLKSKLDFQSIDANTFDKLIIIILKDNLDIIGHYVNFVKEDKTMMYSTIRMWIYDIKKVMEWYCIFTNKNNELRVLFITFQAVISNIGK